MNHWNPTGDLAAALAALREQAPGVAQSALGKRVSRAERALGRPLPEDLRALYGTFSPQSLQAFLESDDIIRLCSVDEVRLWSDEEGIVSQEDLGPAWEHAEFLLIGNTSFGDELLYNLSDGAPAPRGAILVTEHDGESPFMVLAENLADWLSRLVAFSGVELGVVPGGVDDLAPEVALRFVEDHLRLNPQSEWAARKLYAARTPEPDPFIYWDKRERRMRPIHEIAWLTSVSLCDVEADDLGPIAGLKELRYLSLSGCSVSDLSALRSCTKLEWLGINDGPDTSVAPLAALHRLGQLRTGRTLLRDVAELAAIPSLDFLEISGCDFDDVDGIARITSLTKLDLSDTRVSTLAPLVALRDLTYLQIDGTRIRDLTPILEMSSLEIVIVSKGAADSGVIKEIRRRRPGLELSES